MTIKEVENKVLGEYIYVLLSDDVNLFTIRKVREKALKEFSSIYDEKILSINENLKELFQYSEKVIAENFMKKGNTTAVLQFDSLLDVNIDYIKFKTTEDGIIKLYSYKNCR